MKSSSRISRGRWSLEGGYVETQEHLIFTVKGIIHPPDRVIAYLRYIPDPTGDRIRNDVKYKRIYNFEDQISIIKSKYPQYVYYDEIWDVEVQSVPIERIVRVYDPSEGLKKLIKGFNGSDRLAEAAKSFAEELSQESGVDMDFMGISGSLLLSLHKETSDIDFIVYGTSNCIKAREALRKMLAEGRNFRKLGSKYLSEVFNSRSLETPMSYELFVKHEARKVIQGIYRDFIYFIRFIKDLDEINERYGERKIKNKGLAKVKALVTDDSESIFTPCIYKIKCLDVLEGSVKPNELIEVISLRGRFAEQAAKSEIVEIRGKLEEVELRGKRYQRIIIGLPGDYMISLNLKALE
ncbi:MAG: hypothetical protein ACXQTI_02960 [Candidatus Nezhaarchaeales archaeon]